MMVRKMITQSHKHSVPTNRELITFFFNLCNTIETNRELKKFLVAWQKINENKNVFSEEENIMKEFFVNHKSVGHLDKDTYITSRNNARHYFRKGKGYPISDDVLKKLKVAKCKKVVVVEYLANKKTNRYTVPLQKYLDAELFQYKDYDAQRCVPLSEMKKLK